MPVLATATCRQHQLSIGFRPNLPGRQAGGAWDKDTQQALACGTPRGQGGGAAPSGSFWSFWECCSAFARCHTPGAVWPRGRERGLWCQMRLALSPALPFPGDLAHVGMPVVTNRRGWCGHQNPELEQVETGRAWPCLSAARPGARTLGPGLRAPGSPGPTDRSPSGSGIDGPQDMERSPGLGPGCGTWTTPGRPAGLRMARR